MVEVPENFSMNPDQIAQMQQPKTNPLARFMRQPAIYIKLPSNGNFWPQGMLEMPINGELPVLPMSTRDEIAVNTPDALMNGQAVVDMIQSCMPNIRSAWAIPSVDLDTILIAIRIASYGEKMDYTSECPECKNSESYEIDLRPFLDLPVDISGYNTPVEYKGMQIYLKPGDFETINLSNLETFEQQRLVRMINDTNLDEAERLVRFNRIFKTMTEYTVKNVSGSILKIVSPEGETVIDSEFIDDFVTNSERQLYTVIRDKITEINNGIPEKKVTTSCTECEKQYDTPFTFDQANFFVFAS